MATFSKELLSGSTQGKGILVAATATAGTTIHTTGTSASVLDEIWLFATNNDTSSIALTVEFGSTSTDDNIVLTVPSKAGKTLVIPGLILRGNGSAGLTIGAFAGTANKITITGYVNRIG
jgi:hypothetical protein